jgi:hypothetical protein
MIDSFPWAAQRHPPPHTMTIPMEGQRWLPSVGTSNTRARLAALRPHAINLYISEGDLDSFFL